MQKKPPSTLLAEVTAKIPPDELKRLLEARGIALRALASDRMEELPRTELRLALQGLVHRVGLEIERLASAPEDVEHAARAVRNCLETNLIARYVLKSPHNLRTWVKLRVDEEIDVLDSVLKVFGTASDDAGRKPIERRISELKALIEKHGTKTRRLPR